MDTKGTILAIDDESINLELIKEIFENSNFELHTANNGLSGLKKAEELLPDIILLDNMMPGLSGIEVCKKLRSDQKYNKTKIILVSAKVMPAERREGYEAGADDYVIKPFDLDELEAKVNVFAEHTSSEKKLHNLMYELENEASKKASHPIELLSKDLNNCNNYAKIFICLIDKYQELTKFLPEDLCNSAQALLNEINSIQKREDLDFIKQDIVHRVQSSSESIKKISQTIQDCKSFSEYKHTSFEPLNINEEIEQCIKQIQHKLGAKCVIEKHFSGLPIISGIAIQINKLFESLILNSASIIQGKGTIRIETHSMDNSIHIIVHSNSTAMDSHNPNEANTDSSSYVEHMSQLGLNLALSFNIVANHQGELVVKQDQNLTSDYEIKLPIKSEKTTE